jgi:hypothetical protein
VAAPGPGGRCLSAQNQPQPQPQPVAAGRIQSGCATAPLNRSGRRRLRQDREGRAGVASCARARGCRPPDRGRASAGPRTQDRTQRRLARVSAGGATGGQPLSPSWHGRMAAAATRRNPRTGRRLPRSRAHAHARRSPQYASIITSHRTRLDPNLNFYFDWIPFDQPSIHDSII